MSEVADIPSNNVVSWNGTRFGLTPLLSVQAEHILKKGQTMVPVLLNALSDPERFITAHVLLTKITGVQYDSQDSWNGLQIDIEADGNTRFNPDQRQELARRWKQYFETQPTPDKLPQNH